MVRDVVDVRPVGGYRLWLRFDDGLEGEVDLEPVIVFKGVFAPLRDRAHFARVKVNRELGTVVWPNGADWDQLVLYSLVSGRSIEELLSESSPAGR
jgi:hypothetical protein